MTVGFRGRLTKRMWIPLLTAVFVLAGPVRAADLTWIGIGGPMDWQPDPGYSLEIGSTAWTIDANNGGGLVTVDLQVPTVVRVRRLPDCVPVVRFVAQPGGRYDIAFAIDRTARVIDMAGRPMDTPGPPGDPGPLVCPRLPDTSIAAPAIAGGAPNIALLVAAGLAGLALGVTRRPIRR